MGLRAPIVFCYDVSRLCVEDNFAVFIYSKVIDKTIKCSIQTVLLYRKRGIFLSEDAGSCRSFRSGRSSRSYRNNKWILVRRCLMKGYEIASGYMGLVDGEYILFASEADYLEYMDED